MKKVNVMPMVIASTLIIGSCGSVMANGFTGNMGFSGKITKAISVPQWSWKLNQAAVNENKVLTVNVKNATLVGSNYEWAITPTEPLYLSGTVNKSFKNSNQLISFPEISFGGTALNITDQNVTIVATGDKGQKGNLVLKSGMLTQMVLSEHVTSGKYHGSILSNANHVLKANMVSEDLVKSPIVDDYLSKSSPKFSWSVTQTNKSSLPISVDMGTFLKEMKKMIDSNLSSGPSSAGPSSSEYEVVLSLFAGANALKLSFPKANIPDSWTATLPITVTMK